MSGSDYTTTPNLGLFKPTYDADTEQWGTHLNANADVLDAAFAPTGGLFLPIAGGTMTGAVTLAGVSTAPTAVAGTNTTQIASTAFVAAALASAGGVTSFNTRAGVVTLNSADVTTVLPPSSTTPAMNGTAAVGASGKWADGAHVHPSDTTRAPLASPVFTGDPQAPTPAAGDSDTSVATTAFVQAAVATALHNVGRNYVHNPLFNIQQRGVGPWVLASSVSALTADRWAAGFFNGTQSVSLIALADADRTAIGDEAATSALRSVFTGGGAAGSSTAIWQSIEGVRRLSGKTVTVSFWAKAAAGTPKLGFSLDQNFGTGGSPSAYLAGTGQSVTLSTTWTRYALTFTIPSATGKTLGTDGNDSISLNVWFSAGASNAAISGTVGVQSGTVTLWGVQLEIGTQATPLEKPDPQQDWAKCQRFYQLIGSGGTGITLPSYSSSAGAVASSPIWFPPMRAIPTTSQFVGGFAGMATALTVAGASLQTCGTSVTHSAAGYGQTALSLALSADL